MYHGQNGDDTATAADDWKIHVDIKFLKNPPTNSKGLTLDLNHTNKFNTDQLEIQSPHVK